MKHLLSAIAVASLFFPTGVSAALNLGLKQLPPIESLADKLQGRILLQVEQHGEAWYVNQDGLRYYMKNGEAAYEMMRSFGLGISDKDLASIPSVNAAEEFAKATKVCAPSALATKLKGKILLQVEQHGEAWYVDPTTCRRAYMKDGEAAYQLMRLRGLGITDADLTDIHPGYLLSSQCDHSEMTDDGVVARFVCETKEASVIATGNRVTQAVDIALEVSVGDEQWIDVDGVRVSAVPFMIELVGLAGTYLADVSIQSLSSETSALGSVKEFDQGIGFLESNAIKSFHVSFLVQDKTTGNPLASVDVVNGFSPSYSDFQHLTAEQSYGGLVLGEPVTQDRLLELLFSESFLGSVSSVNDSLDGLFGGL